MKLYQLIFCVNLFMVTFISNAQTYTLNSNLGTITTCSGTFVDQGGSGGNYNNNSDYTVTFCSGTSQSLRFDFSQLNLDTGYDFLTVFDGPSTASPQTDNISGNIGAYTLQSSGPCITFRFTSDALVRRAGWLATISCVTPCVTPIASAISTNQISPIKVCLNEVVNFDGSASTAGSGFNLVNYLWNFDDATTATGATTSHSFSNPGRYIIQLKVTDNNGCSNNNLTDLIVDVGTVPNFVGTTPNQNACVNSSVCIDGIVNPTTWQDIPQTEVAGTTSLPDGSGVCYEVPLTFTQFIPGSTITSASQVQNIFANLEHTWAGDLSINLICPNNQVVGLFNADGTWNTTNISSENFGNALATPPTGFDYTWTNSGTTIDGWGAANPGATSSTSIPSGTYGSEQSFSSLIGCPLNGTWILKVCDLFSSDAGTVFSWGMTLDPALYAGVASITPIINANCTGGSWSGLDVASTAAITTTSANCDQICVSSATPGTFNYQYNVTDDFGCSYDTTISIVINNCGCTVIANNSGQVCANGSFNLTASTVIGATSYSWTGPGSFTSNVQNPTSVTAPSTPGLYSYVVTVNSPSGTCTSTTNLTVLANPTINLGAAPSAICVGASSTLTVSGGVNYTWSNGLSNATSHSVSPASTATYTVSGTDANGCVNSSNVTVVVNNAPTITSNASPAAICNGDFTTLTASGGNIYTWDNGLGIGNNFSINPNATITYNIIGTDANGCTNTSQVTVTVNALPIIDAGLPFAVCSGQTATLNGSGGNTYTWSNGVTNGTAFTPANTATYTVSGTDLNGCVNTDQVTVTVNALPTVDAGSPVSVCPGQSVTLNGSGANTYSWDNGVTNGTSFIPSGTTTYTVTGTDANNCTNTDQVLVTVNTLPTITASAAPASICQGQSTVLTGNGGTSYSWDNGLGAGNNLTASPNATTTYNVSGTDANGCVNTAQVTVTVNPNTPVNAGADQTVCAGQQVTLTASGTPTNTWDNGVNDGTAFTPASTTTYTVTGTSANGCVTTDQVTVTVNALPNINAGVDQTVCVGQSVTLVGSNGQTYTWDNGVTNGTAFTVGTTTTYTVTGTDANGCIGTDQVTVTALPVPVADVSSDVTSGSVALQVTFYNNSANATNYTWNFGTGVPVNTNNTNDQTYTYVNAGTYSVVLTASNGYCSDTAMLVINVIPLPPPSVTPPNIFTPNNDGENDVYFLPYTNLASIEVYIQNRWGNTMYEYNTLNGHWDGKIEGKEADEGVYFYKYKAKGINGEELTGHGFFHLER